MRAPRAGEEAVAEGGTRSRADGVTPAPPTPVVPSVTSQRAGRLTQQLSQKAKVKDRLFSFSGRVTCGFTAVGSEASVSEM